MADYAQGFFGTAAATVEALNDVTAVIRNFYQNRNPVLTRTGNVPLSTVPFDMYNHKYRPNATTLITTAISSGSTTSITVNDNTFMMNHDVYSWVDATTGVEEQWQVSGDPNADGHTLTIIRGVAGTTAATNVPINGTIYAISNSRTGSEIDQTGLSTIGVKHTSYAQTFQFPVQVGGSAATNQATVMPGGVMSPFDFHKTMQLQNMVDSIELAFYYGLPQAPVDNTVTAKMAGIRSLMLTNKVTAASNSGTGPTNGSAYTISDFTRDTLEAAHSGGGDPDLMFISTNFMSGLAMWGNGVQRVPAGETRLGTPINVIEAPFLNGVTLIEAPLLRRFTAFCVTSSELYRRVKRAPFWNPRGNRGDMYEGEWIAELAIELANESHHAWVEGISAFSAS